MIFFDLILQNVISPAILFFVLGVLAGLFKSDLQVPDSISKFLAIYLMMAIGFKGGVAVPSQLSITIVLAIICGVLVSLFLPFLGYFLLKRTTKLDNLTAAAVAAHYGSISVVTFAAAISFLKAYAVTYEGYIVAILAIMEAPAIFSGLFLAHKFGTHKTEERKLVGEILTNGAVLLLVGSFIIGWLTGTPGLEKVEGFFVVPFQGFLCLFLLDMGLLVAKNFNYLKAFSWNLFLFGIYMPLIGATIGLSIAKLLGLDLGTGMLFVVLCASASYIAVPAAMRLVLPEAKPSIYVPMSLAITFPFNIIFGIPLYYSLSKLILIA